jgi:hypothetical protein
LTVTKRYKGQSGFLRFIQDFSSGSRSFSINDFADPDAPAEWPRLADTLRRYHITTIRVFYRVDPPPSLLTLMRRAPSAMLPPTIIKK